MRKKISMLLTLVLALTLFCPSFIYAETTEQRTKEQNEAGQQTIHYVALGDSITTGYELPGYDISDPDSWKNVNCYVDQVAEYLGQKADVTTDDLAVNGSTSSDLLNALTNASDSRYSQYMRTLAQADVVTIGIGSNDLMYPITDILYQEFHCTEATFHQTVGELLNRCQSSSCITAWKARLELAAHLCSLKIQYINNPKVIKSIQKFDNNLTGIVRAVEQIAPDAQIYVNNIYDPYVDYVLRYSNIPVFNVTVYAERYIAKMNKCITSHTSLGYTVVNVYGVMRSQSLVNADDETLNIDAHPNEAGHRQIAQAIIASMQKNGL